MAGTFAVTRSTDSDFDDRPQRNKALVLEAMTSLFQRRDASAVERLYAPNNIQHNPSDRGLRVTLLAASARRHASGAKPPGSLRRRDGTLESSAPDRTSRRPATPGTSTPLSSAAAAAPTQLAGG